MRERSYAINTQILEDLHRQYRSANVARTLGISKQRWYMYKIGKNDMPESVAAALCKAYKIPLTSLRKEN